MELQVQISVPLDTIRVVGAPSLAELRDMSARCAREEAVAFPVTAVVGYSLDDRRRLSGSSAPLEVELEVRAKREACSESDYIQTYTFFGMIGVIPVRVTFVVDRADGTITSSVGVPNSRMRALLLRDWS